RRCHRWPGDTGCRRDRANRRRRRRRSVGLARGRRGPRGVIGSLATGHGNANLTIIALHFVRVLRVHLDDDTDDVWTVLRVSNVGYAATRDLVVGPVSHVERGSFQIDNYPSGRVEREVLHIDGGVDPDHHFSLPG